MINKIYLILNIPMLETKFDILVPAGKDYSTFLNLVIKSVAELTDNYFPLKSSLLINSQTGVVYNENITIKEMGLKNGDEIILV